MTGHAQSSADFGKAKFEPPEGQKLLIIGQDANSVGGLPQYYNGYVDHLETPAGITTYTSIESLTGLTEVTNWGAGDICAQCYVDDPSFDNSVLVIGLYLVDMLDDIAAGKKDYNINRLGQWIKNQDRPIFLRIGYEFEGPWNRYEPRAFVKAWKHIVHHMDSLEVNNISYVWQSAGLNYINIEDWYPGDEYVNWMGYSQFDGQHMGEKIKAFARKRSKPIMIAEATPRLKIHKGKAKKHWSNWYERVLREIHEDDNIKAFAYINANWDRQTMWMGQGWGNSQVQDDPYIRKKWEEEFTKDCWLRASENLFEQLHYTSH